MKVGNKCVNKTRESSETYKIYHTTGNFYNLMGSIMPKKYCKLMKWTFQYYSFFIQLVFLVLSISVKISINKKLLSIDGKKNNKNDNFLKNLNV